MAHNLNFKDGKASFAGTQKAWHGLGVTVEKAMTSEEAIKLAQLDYDVVKMPIYADFNGKKLAIEDKYATMRTDTEDVFGVVGARYEITQNRDAFTFFDSIVGANQAIFESAGSLGLGERIFVSAKMPEYIRIAGTDDITEVFVLLTSSHDGSGAVIGCVTNVRVCCQNTLNAALKGTTNKVAIRHTKNSEAKLAQAHKLLGISNDYITKANEVFNYLALKKVTDAQVKQLVTELFPSIKEEESTRILNIRESVLNSYYTGIGQAEILGTAWSAFNGVTHFLDHVKEYKDADTKFSSIVDGASSKVVDKAMELLIAM